ncbi:MAG: hypothetical protein V3R86_02440 [Candidatus Hydrothermarchaeaceae archaeon]
MDTEKAHSSGLKWPALLSLILGIIAIPAPAYSAVYGGGGAFPESMALVDNGPAEEVLSPLEGPKAILQEDEGPQIVVSHRIHQEHDRGRGKIIIELRAREGQTVKAALVKEYINKKLAVSPSGGVFTGFGVMWKAGTVEQSKTLSYTLRLPTVEEPATYEIKTVVEFQTRENLETVEKISYLTVNPDGQVMISGGRETSEVTAEGKGFTRVYWARPSFDAQRSPDVVKKDEKKEKGKGDKGNGKKGGNDDGGEDDDDPDEDDDNDDEGEDDDQGDDDPDEDNDDDSGGNGGNGGGKGGKGKGKTK